MTERISNCCNSKMKYVYNDYDSNYTCLKCNKPSYFKFEETLEHTTKPLLSKKRHLLKAVTYRIYSSCITFLISFIVTGNCNVGLSIGVLDFTVKIFTYYFHERFWYRINFGKIIQSKKEFDLDELRISIKQKIESCENMAEKFKSSDMVTSELCSNAMKQAYNNILNELTK